MDVGDGCALGVRHCALVQSSSHTEPALICGACKGVSLDTHVLGFLCKGCTRGCLALAWPFLALAWPFLALLLTSPLRSLPSRSLDINGNVLPACPVVPMKPRLRPTRSINSAKSAFKALEECSQL